MENLLPTFWSEALSHIFENAPVRLGSDDGEGIIHKGHKVNNQSAPPRKGQRTSTVEKREKARKLRAAGHSYGEIAKVLGVGRSYAHKLVNESTEESPSYGTQQPVPAQRPRRASIRAREISVTVLTLCLALGLESAA